MTDIGHANLTLTGSPQSFADVLPANIDRKGRQIWVQPDPMNVGVIYYGTTATMAADDYGFVLPAPENGIPHAPFLFGELHPMPLKKMFCLGSENEVLHFYWII